MRIIENGMAESAIAYGDSVDVSTVNMAVRFAWYCATGTPHFGAMFGE